MNHEKADVDGLLLYELSKITNGSNVHDIKNYLGVYMGFLEMYNNTGIQKHLDRAMDMEKEIRGFIFKERMKLLPTVQY